MGKAILFIRVSTEQQHLESQEDTLKRAAVADGYREEDFIIIGKKESAIKLDEDNRQGLQELKKQLSEGDIDCIYIFELSRLSRKPMVLYSIRDQLLDARVQLKCLNPAFTLLNSERTGFDNTASLIFSLFGAMAEQEMIEKRNVSAVVNEDWQKRDVIMAGIFLSDTGLTRNIKIKSLSTMKRPD